MNIPNNKNSKQVDIAKTKTAQSLAKPIYQPIKQNTLSKGEQFLAIISAFDDDFVDGVADRYNDPI